MRRIEDYDKPQNPAVVKHSELLPNAGGVGFIMWLDAALETRSF